MFTSTLPIDRLALTGLESWHGSSEDGIEIYLQFWQKKGVGLGSAHFLCAGDIRSFQAVLQNGQIALSDATGLCYDLKWGTPSGVLVDIKTGHEIPVRMQQMLEDQGPPPLPVNRREDDVPVMVSYDAHLNDGTHIHLGNFSFTPIVVPVGTWSGTTLWGNNNGLCWPVFNLFAWRVEITLTTSNPFSHVGYLKFTRGILGQEEQESTKDLVDSWLYPKDSWIPAYGQITQHPNK